mgnify:CR=1 FL=1
MRTPTKFTFLITLIVALVLPISSNALGYLNAGDASGSGHGGTTGSSIGQTPPPSGHGNGKTAPERQEFGGEAIASVPEPMTWLLVGLGLAGIGLASRSRAVAR